MQFYEREFLLSRIRAGHVIFKDKGIKLYIHSVTKDVNYEAQEVYSDKYKFALEDDMLEDKDVFLLLKNRGIWSDEDEKQLTDILPKHIEEWKVKLFDAKGNFDQQKQIRKYLDVAKKTLLEKLEIRHSLDYTTAEGFASYCRWLFVIKHSTLYPDGSPYGWDTVSIPVVLKHYHEQAISDGQLRELARTEPWISIWRANTGHYFFCEDATDLTRDQASLLNWSAFYSSIVEAPDCPNQKIISDDDMLDGWLIKKRREREREQLKASVDANLKGNAQEYFIKVNDDVTAEDIQSLNDPLANMTVKQRMAKIEKEGVVKVQQFTDVKQKLKIDAQNKFKETIKGI